MHILPFYIIFYQTGIGPSSDNQVLLPTQDIVHGGLCSPVFAIIILYAILLLYHTSAPSSPEESTILSRNTTAHLSILYSASLYHHKLFLCASLKALSMCFFFHELQLHSPIAWCLLEALQDMCPKISMICWYWSYVNPFCILYLINIQLLYLYSFDLKFPFFPIALTLELRLPLQWFGNRRKRTQSCIRSVSIASFVLLYSNLETWCHQAGITRTAQNTSQTK